MHNSKGSLFKNSVPSKFCHDTSGMNKWITAIVQALGDFTIPDLAEIVTGYIPVRVCYDDSCFDETTITSGITVFGLYQGLFTSKWPNGKMKTIRHWMNGKRHGSEWVWFDNGKISYSREWLNGKRHGLELDWYHGGELRFRQHFDHGRLHGCEERWFRDGRCYRKTLWNHGNVLRRDIDI